MIAINAVKIYIYIPGGMRILIATNSYPTKKNPTRQVFVKNIYSEIKILNIKTDLVYNRYFRVFKSDLGAGTVFTSFFKVIAMAVSYAYCLLRYRNYEIIYSHGSILPGIFVMLTKPFHNAKHVCYAHGSEEEYLIRKGLLFRISRFVLKKSDLVVTNSIYMQELLKDNYGCQSALIHPGYNSRVFFYAPASKTIDIFFAGHAIERKGIDLLLKAISEYEDYYRDRKLSIHIHFSGGAEKEYHHFARKSGIDNIITFGGRLKEQQLADHYRKTKVVVVPSKREPLGLVGIEAIACGALLVASNTGGIKEYVKDGLNGFLFKNENYHDLHQKIKEALEQYTIHSKKLPSIAESVEGYSVRESAHNTIRIFNELIYPAN